VVKIQPEIAYQYALKASQARDYLPHMCGDSNYVVIEGIQKLPHRISDIYRGLTS
jgi:nitric oxide reductase activation protein